MPDNKKKFSDWEKELYPPKEVKGVGLLEMTEQLKQQPEPESQKIEPPPIEQQKSIEPLQIQPSQTDYDILKQRYKDAQTEMSAFEQHRQRLNAPEPTTPQATKEQLEYKGASLGEYGAYIGEKNVQKEEAKRIEQGIKEQGIEFIKQERLKKQYEEQQKIKALQQNLNPDIDKKIKEYEDKQPAWTEQFSLIHKPAKNEEEQLHYDIQSQLYNNDRLNYDIARNVLRDTKNILNAPIKTEGGGFFEATSNELKQLDTWVTIAGLSDNLQKSSVIKYAQTGKPLTTSESALLDAVFDYYYVSNERAGNISKAYIGGQIAGKSIPFMIDFVMTGGFASGATGGFGKAMAKHIENKLINKFGKEAYKKLTKTGVDRLIKAPGKFGEEVVAGAIQAPMTPTFYTGVIEETMAKPIEKTDKGYVFQQGAPIKDAVIRGMNEVIFERSGEFIGDVFSPLGKALSSVNYFTKIPSTKLKNFNRLFYGGKGTFAETLKATGFNGLSSEMGKEVLGQVANYVTGASTKEELDEFFSKDNFQAMLMGFAPMTGVSVAGNVAQRLIVNNNHKKAVNNINTDFGNQAPDVIAALNETSPDRIQNIVDEIMLNNGGYEGNKITDKGKRMATDMLRYIYTKAQVEAVKGIDQDNYKTIGAPKSAENYLQDGKHTVSLYDEQGEVIVQKQFENEEAAEKYKQKLNEMYMTPNNEFDNKINEGLNNLTQKTVTKLNALKSNQKNANGEDVIVSAIVQGLSSEAIGVPNGTEIYVKADNGKQSIVQYVENGELKKAVIPNENITEKQEELLSDAFTQYMETATKTMYQTAAQTNQVIMEGLAEEENMTTNDFSTKKAGHKIKYDGKEATIQSVDTDNDGNKYADLELEDGSIIKSVPLRNVKNPKTVTFNVGKQRIELSKSNETGYFQSEIYSKEKAETIKNGIQISDDYISEIKEQPNPANPIEKGYRVIIREKTEEEKQSKTEVFDMLKTNIVENGLYIRNKKGFVSIIPADEIEINELTDKGELRFTDKESGIPIIMPLENQQELKAEYEQQQLETQKGTTTEVKPETTTVESKVETEPTYKGLFEQTKQQYGVETAIQDIQDEITLKNQQLEEVNNKLKKASLKEKATLREQLQFINRELTELNNILKSEEYAIKERNVAEDNIQKYQSRDEGGETAEASRSDSVEPSTEKQSENEPQPIVETPVSEDKKVVAPTKPQGVEVPTEKKVGEKAVKQYSELTETERKLIDVSNKRIGGKLDVDNVILIAEKIAKSENKEIDVQHVLEALNYEMSKNDPTYGRLTTDDVNGDIVDGNIRVAMLERMEEVGVLPKDGVAEIKKAKELADRIKKMNLSTNVKSLLKTTIDRFYVLDANQNNNSLGIGVVDNINDLLDRIDKNKDNSYFTDKKGKKTKLTFDQVVSQEIYNKIKEGEPTEDGENPTIKESLQVEEPKLSLSELPKKSYATINFYDGDTRTGEIIKETDKEISIKSDIGRIYTVPKSNIVERYDEKPQPKFAISKQPLSNLSSKQPLSNLLSEIDSGIKVSNIGFYSTVEKALQSIKQDKGTKEQFKVMLLNNGAKQAEMDWMGFDELPEKLTKSDIQEWIDENRIEVEEVEKGAYSNRDLELVKVEPFVYNVVDTKTGKVVLSNVSQSRADDFIDNAHDGTDTKFAQYTLLGGENYKEVLLTMPTVKRSMPFADYLKAYRERFPQSDSTDKEVREYYNIGVNVPEQGRSTASTEGFRSSHFDEPNILAHIRFNERTDSEGNKVLFIEEIQSDWAQTGKKEGFKSGLTYKIEAPTQEMQDNGNFDYTAIISDESGNEVARRSMFNKLELENWARTKTDRGTTPNMPFKKTDQWVNLALRRMMRYAAENGFDRIAWTTGEQQAERYDLSKQVSLMSLSKNKTGTYNLVIEDLQGQELPEYRGSGKPVTASELEDTVGKEYAKNLIEGADRNYGREWEKNMSINPEFYTLRTKDFKVGGSGMKAFYDGIIPSAMNKLGKPFNAKAETIKMDIGEQQSIPVTEKMKQTALEGLPLFLKTPNGEIYGFAKKPQPKFAILKQPLSNLSSEERLAAVKTVITQINDGKNVEVVDDMVTYLEKLFKNNPNTLERINNLKNAGGIVTGVTIGDKIIINSNQATINDCVAAFEHERQHVENKNDKTWNDLQNDIARNVDIKTLQKEVSGLSGNAFYEGLNINVLADEYIAHIAQQTFEGKEVKSILKYKNIIQDEYRSRNGNRLAILGRESYTDESTEGNIRQGKFDNVAEEGRFLGSNQVSEEEQQIIFEAKVNDTYLKAPNGKSTNLNEKQWVQVRTKAFKDWFGDWENDPENASKVVDENGEPLVVYHGGGANIIAFDYDKIGMQGRSEGAGFEFTENIELAKNYAKNHGEGLYSVFLNIKNPIKDVNQKTLSRAQKVKLLTKFNEKVNANEAYTSDLGKDVIFSDYTETQNIPKAIIEIVNMLVDDTDLDFINEFINTTHMNKEILEAFKETTGYDGVILDKTNEWAENGLYVAFTNTQIKSATANIGTFDVENEDIRFASSPTEQQRQAINYINEIADSETVKDAEASTNYRKAYIERYEVLKAKLTAKNPNIVETYQDVLKYLEALANDKTWSRWDKSARPQLKSIRDSVKELKKAGSIRGLKNKLDKAVDIVLERQNETARRIIKNFVNQKLEGKKGKGVRIPKLVDDTTRQFFDSIKEWINKDSQSIDNELQKLQNEYETKKAGNEKNRLEAQIKAFTYIQHYKSGIKRREDNISNIIIEINKLSKEYTLKDIRKEISLKYSLIAKNKKRLEKADERTKVDIIEENINLKKEIEDKQKEYKLLKQSITLSKANKGQLETLKTALLNERISMQNSMETFIKQLDMVLREGIKAKRLFAEKEEIKKHAILKDIYLEFAMSEMESVINPAKKESKLAVWRKILLDPIYTFSYMLKSFAIYSPDGRGRLYERFFTNGVMVARQKELNGIEEATKAIDVKIIEIFGEGNHITQVQNICNKFNGASITIKTKVNKLNAEKGEYEVIEQEHIQEINNGQALYIYAIAKMPDGMIKLNAMGIDQEQIDAVTTTLDPKLIEFMDWVQDEYLPVLRAKYNDTHIDLFGTQLDQIDKYFPLNIDRSAIPSEVDIEDKGNFFGLPTTITGSIINRVFNKHAIDIRNSDAIETLINHVQSMEKWNAYAPVIKDLNILNSDNTFKKHIDRYIFHGAANLFKDMCAIAVGSYVPKGSIVEDVITTLTKIYARSKIVLRLNTALKQGLSLVQIIGEADPKFMENAMKNIANPLSFKWALDNLPLFRERWESRTGGDDRLSLTRETTEGAAKKIMDIINKTSNIGMIPNAAVDLYVCGIIAKAMYETKYNFYKKERGYSTEESIDKALKDAEIVYNEAQQSAEDMYLSRTQKDRTFMAASISLFNNASFSYQRLFFEGVTAVLKQIKPKGRERLKATQKAKYIVEGRTPEVAEQYAKNDVNRALAKGIMQIGLNGYLVQFVWNVGSSIGIMKALKYILVLFGDDDRDKEIAIDNFKEDMRNAAIKSLTTPVRGLPGGKELESLTELYLKGWNIRQMNVESNPLITDTKQTFNDLSEGYKNNDWVKIVNAFVRYSSGFTGVDLNTIANVIYGIYDLIENHENLTTSDVLLDLSLIINSPMSEQKFLAVSRRDNDTFEDIVNRYIELKRVHKYGSFTPFTDKEDSKAKQDVAKIINVRYHTLKDMLNEYDKAIETYNKFHTDDYIDLYVNPSYKNASDLKYELEYTAKNDMLNETQLGALKTAIESLEKDESLNEIYKKAKKDAWSTSRQKEPELE